MEGVVIERLAVENVAIIEAAQFEPGTGLTVLTGETGGGKSLLVDAIQLALGERADTDLIRTGADRARVHITMRLGDAYADLVRADGIPVEDGRVEIVREVLAAGRSSCRVNGQSIPVSALRALARRLVDLNGQHDHQRLLDPVQHAVFLDAWIGQPAEDAKRAVADAYAARLDAERQLATLRKHLADRGARLEQLREQIAELRAYGPVEGEIALLEAELSRLQNFERLSTETAAAHATLTEERGGRDALADCVAHLEIAARFDPSLEPTVEGLRAALVFADEAAHALNAYLTDLEGDPARLETVAARLDAFRRLARKYGPNERDLLNALASAEEEAATLSDASASLEAFEAKRNAAAAAHVRACEALTRLRRRHAPEFAERVRTELTDLDMVRAQFEVALRPREPDAEGADGVEFLFSANLGESPKPLAKIASGGEASRAMLAIKCAMAGLAHVPTLVFDEVDTGLGGRAAAKVAAKLEQLARTSQVLAISHLPQIAARGADHFRIVKQERGGRVATDVRRLTRTERIEEIARMMVGDALTPAALQNAEELLG